MSNGENERPDIDKHVEHLRTIHFTLLLSCLALLISVQILPNRPLYSGLNQVRKLRNVIVPKLNDTFTKDFINEIVQEIKRMSAHAEKGLGDYGTYKLIRGMAPHENVKMTTKEITSIFKSYPKLEYWTPPESILIGKKFAGFKADESYCCLITVNYKGEGRTYNVYIKSSSFVQPHYLEQTTITPITNNTIEETQRAWDNLILHRTIRVPWNWTLTDEKVLPEEIRANISYPQDHMGEGDNLYLTSISEELVEGQGVFSSQKDQNQKITFNIRAKYRVRYLDINVEPGKWLSGSVNANFDQTFKELQAVRKQLEIQEPSLKEIEDKIDKEVIKGTESISLFSVKIPSTLISIWGAVILIGLQSYYLMHLKFYRILLKLNYTFKVPWIGYYQDSLSRFVTIVTSLILPPVTLGILLWNNLTLAPGFWRLFTLLTATAASVSISYSTKAPLFSIRAIYGSGDQAKW